MRNLQVSTACSPQMTHNLLNQRNFCGSEFIREYDIADDNNASTILSLSQMNSLPQNSHPPCQNRCQPEVAS